MAEDTLSKDIITYDPLTETTRKERTSLLGLSMLGVALVKVPLVPEKFSALGVDFKEINQVVFVQLYSLIIGYYVAAFAIYAFSDYVAWRRKEVLMQKALEEEMIERTANKRVDLDNMVGDRIARLVSAGRNLATGRGFSGVARTNVAFCVARTRAVFEFLMPLGFAGYAIWVLLSYTPSEM